MALDIRPLDRWEMNDAAVVHRAAFDDCLPWLAGLHTPEEDRAYFSGHVFRECEVWGAWDEARLIGFIAFREGWVDQLYVVPLGQAQGVGGRLLEIAKRRYRELRLWTFQRNDRARRFYETRGFVAIDQTDGAQNEAREPDVLYRWRAE